MSLPLPVLDDRRFADLVDEATSLIPAYQPDWTDYNPSDPGITLVELFAWLTEMLIYRSDQVPERHVRAFLRLLNPNAPSTGDLEADVTATIQALRHEVRAVTVADFEQHARAVPGVARSRCVPLRDLSPASEQDRLLPEPAHVSVIVVPNAGVEPSSLIDSVAADLEPRRLITTRVAVVEPIWTPITVHALVARPPDVIQGVPAAIDTACANLLDSLAGGTGATGWPFGRPVYLADLIASIEALPQIDHLVDLDLTSSCDGAVSRCVAGSPLIAVDGHMSGMQLGQEALPQLVRPVDVTSSGQFLPVTAQIRATLGAGVSESPALLRQIIRTVADLVWPGRGWQTQPGTPGTLDTATITGAVVAIAGVASVQSVTLIADPARVTRATNGIVSVAVGPLELVDLTVEAFLTPA